MKEQSEQDDNAIEWWSKNGISYAGLQSTFLILNIIANFWEQILTQDMKSNF